jgi:hypothetical protein
MTAKRQPKTPSKYDSIIITEYERYKADCGMKIGDHKIWCKLLDKQDQNTLRMLKAQREDVRKIMDEAYEFHALNIAATVREMLAEQRTEIATMLEDHKQQIFGRIDKMEKSLAEMRCVVNQTEEDVKRLKFLNSWWIILLRGAGWTTLGYLIVRWFHGAWNS